MNGKFPLLPWFVRFDQARMLDFLTLIVIQSIGGVKDVPRSISWLDCGEQLAAYDMAHPDIEPLKHHESNQCIG